MTIIAWTWTGQEEATSMVIELIPVALGVVIGLPILLFGVMRHDEVRGRLSIAALILGLLLTFGPVVVASVIHYRETGNDERYGGR